MVVQMILETSAVKETMQADIDFCKLNQQMLSDPTWDSIGFFQIQINNQ